MIHWAPLHLEFLVRMAPLPSAGKWLPNFAVFRELVLPSHTLFSAIEVAGHFVVILEVFLKSLFTHRQLLNSLYLVFFYRSGYAVTNSFTVHSFLFVFASLVGLSAGLVAALSARSSSAARLARAASNTHCPIIVLQITLTLVFACLST